jgi:predicted transcriptional regulator
LSSEQADFPVLDADDGRVVGLVARDDVLRGLRTHGATARVTDAMRTTFPTATPDESLDALQRRMLGEGGQAMPVLDASGRLVGLLTAMDVNEAFWLLSAKNEAKRASTSMDRSESSQIREESTKRIWLDFRRLICQRQVVLGVSEQACPLRGIEDLPHR